MAEPGLLDVSLPPHAQEGQPGGRAGTLQVDPWPFQPGGKQRNLLKSRPSLTHPHSGRDRSLRWDKSSGGQPACSLPSPGCSQVGLTSCPPSAQASAPAVGPLPYSPSCPGLWLQSQHSCREAAFSHHLGLPSGGSASRGVWVMVHQGRRGGVKPGKLVPPPACPPVPSASPRLTSWDSQHLSQKISQDPVHSPLRRGGRLEGGNWQDCNLFGTGTRSEVGSVSVTHFFTHSPIHPLCAGQGWWGAYCVRRCSEHREAAVLNKTVFIEQQSGRKDGL